MHNKWSNLGRYFWVQWLIAIMITTIVIGPISLFLGFNSIVSLIGWESVDPWWLVAAYIIAVILGMFVGGIEWIYLNHKISINRHRVFSSIIGGFALNAFLSALGSNFLSAGLYGISVLLCTIGLFFWLIGMIVMVLIPKTWPIQTIVSIKCQNITY
jgi:hypothetical protein